MGLVNSENISPVPCKVIPFGSHHNNSIEKSVYKTQRFVRFVCKNVCKFAYIDGGGTRIIHESGVSLAIRRPGFTAPMNYWKTDVL